jgi:hypothetical protein
MLPAPRSAPPCCVPWFNDIACSDSRIDPNLLTQNEPGELLVYQFETGQVFSYDSQQGQFIPIEETPDSRKPEADRGHAIRTTGG